MFLLGWLVRPVVRGARLVWRAFRIEHGSIVSMTMLGDRQGFAPEVLCVGLRRC